MSLWLWALVGCSDYGFSTEPDPSDVDVEDTAALATCGEPDLAPIGPELTVPCEAAPIVGSFTPVTEWNWRDNPVHPGFQQIMAAPAVANLTDDNGDGVVDASDVPDVVFTAFSGGAYGSPGALVAISGSDGATLWSVMDAGGYQPYASSGVAIADLSGTGDPVVLVSATDGLLCVDRHGAFRWHAALPTSTYGHPSVADLEGDGVPEIIFGPNAVRANGAVLWSAGGGSTTDYAAFALDLDGDGRKEVVSGNRLFGSDGTLLWDDGTGTGWPAVGDLDGDGEPEIVKVQSGKVQAHRVDGTLVWEVTLPDGGGGPPTVADFDGDGRAEIGVASREVYRVLDGDGSTLWANTIKDYSSSRTGSSVFDFEGDGAAEVVYADEETLWVFDGRTGAIEMAWDSHASGTLYEYPLIVDVDGDGATEIVVASNDYAFAGNRGITVIGDLDGSWAPARPIWNQHAYHITNVNDDGSIPATPPAHWKSWNSFRAGNSETAVGLAQPDLRLGTPEECLMECYEDRALIWLPVENAGVVDASGVRVALYAKSGLDETLVTVLEAGDIPAGGGVWLGPLDLDRGDFGTDGLVAKVDDDGAGQGATAECVESNNSRRWSTFPCP